MKRKLLSMLLCLSMAFSLSTQLILPAKAFGESDWVEASQVPDTAEITNRKWVYNKTTYVDSKETSLEGYEQVGFDWVVSSSGSKNYAAFPSGFDPSHSIYTSFHRSSSPPYTAYENATTKRTVSNSWGGYVYWHWMYDTSYANGTSGRAIYHKKGTGPDNGFYYKYFGAFTSTAWDYSSSTGYCNSQNIRNYIIPNRTSWDLCQGATRWFRFEYNTCYYTDYYKLFHYKKVEQMESATEITESGTSNEVISDVKEMVKFKNTFTVTYDANSGESAPASQTKEFDVPLTITADQPTRSGYLFMGWSVDPMALAGSYQPGDTFVSNGDYTLYAIWQNATKYTITYDYATNGGTSCPMSSVSIFQDEKADLAVQAEKPGWTFVGWNTDPAATTGLESHIVKGDATLYAIFKKTASADLYAGENTKEDTKEETFFNQENGSTITLPEIPGYAGWKAHSWVRSTDKEAFQPGEQVLLTDNVSFYAKYSKSVLLTYFANGGEGAPGGEQITLYYLADGTCEHDPVILASPIQREGYRFDKWAYGGPDGTKYAAGDSLMLDKNTETSVVMYATWTKLEVLPTPIWKTTPISTGQQITLTVQGNAPIYYTTDGTTPTAASKNLYKNPVKLEKAGTYTIKALAIQDGYADSQLMTTTVKVEAAKQPTASIPAGYVKAGETVTLTAPDGGTIYYTTNGQEPTLSSAVYTAPIAIDDNVTIKAMVARDGYAKSAAVSYEYRMIPNYSVDRHGYDFGNRASSFGYTDTSPSLRGYCIPYSSVKYIFGDSVKGKSVYTSMTKYAWAGNCCGMASTSALFFNLDTEITASDFGKEYANDLGITATAGEYNDLVLKAFIEAMQISQYTVQFDRDYSQNKVSVNQLKSGETLDALYQNVKEHLESNENDIIAVGMPGVGAHALLAYRIEDVSAAESRLYVYDCNNPDKTTDYVTLKKNANGNFVEWSYDMGGYGVWGSSDVRNAYISYIPFTTISEIWENRGRLYDNYLTLTVNAENVAIYNLDNELVGQFIDGEFYTGQDDVYAIPNLSMTTEGDYSVYLPEDFYIVENQGTGDFEASMVGESLGATVSTNAEAICFEMNEGTKLNDISIENAGVNNSYTISLDSNTTGAGETVFRNVTLSGTGKGETLQVSSDATGRLSVSNCNIGSMKVDGQEQIKYNFTASVVGKGGSLSESGDIEVPAKEDKTFRIIPDAGYRIKDVKVDGISIGPVEEYTFENVGAEHRLHAYFEPLYLIGKAELDGQKVYVTLNNDQTVNLCAAVYSQDGQMLDIAMARVQADAGKAEVELKNDLPPRCEIRVFLLGRNDMEPLCDIKTLYP